MLHNVNPNHIDRYYVYFVNHNQTVKTMVSEYGDHPTTKLRDLNVDQMYDNPNCIYTQKQLNWIIPSLRKYQSSHHMGDIHVSNVHTHTTRIVK